MKNQTSVPDREPCPFCESKKITMITDIERHNLRCTNCLAEGSEMPTEEFATIAWNKAERKIQ